MAKYRKTLDLSEMSMSATLRADKKGTSYTVKKIGKKKITQKNKKCTYTL